MLLPTLVLSLSLAAASPAPQGPWLADLAAARTESKSTGRPIFVELHAAWCGWCSVLEEKVLSTPKFQTYAKRFVLLRLDTEDGADGSMIDGRYGVNSLPTVLLLRDDLVEIGVLEGFAPLDEYIHRVDRELEKWASLETSYQQAASGKAGEDLRALAEELHKRGDGRRAATIYRRILSEPAAASAATTDTAKAANLVGWTHYLLADALRMAEDYESAQREIGEAKRLIARSPEPGASQKSTESLIERLDLLAVQVAEDRGDCRSQVSALESFLKLHPQSDYRSQAQQSLRTLKSEGGAQCG